MLLEDCHAYNFLKTTELDSDACQLIMADNFVANADYDAVINDEGKYRL